MSVIEMDIRGCARCQGEHSALEFKPLAHPIRPGGSPLTHWAPCPTNGEPILMLVGKPAVAQDV